MRYNGWLHWTADGKNTPAVRIPDGRKKAPSRFRLGAEP
jgi:hypothetical protein